MAREVFEKGKRRATIVPSKSFGGFNVTAWTYLEALKKWKIVQRRLWKGREIAERKAKAWVNKAEYLK